MPTILPRLACLRSESLKVRMKAILPALLIMAVCTTLAPAAELLAPNKIVARKILEEVLGQGKIAENEHLYAPDFKAHGITSAVGRAEDREATKAWRAAFPDLRMTVTHVVAEGDYVTVRYIGEGTNTGSFQGLAATGKSVRVSGITIFRIVNSQVTDEWTSFDEMGLLNQLGLLPAKS